MKLQRFLVLAATAGLTLVAACTGTREGLYGPRPVPEHIPDAAAERARLERLVAEDKARSTDRVEISDAPFVSTKPAQPRRGKWLESIRVTVLEPNRPLPVSELIRMLQVEGVAITSQLPLNTFYYSGFGVVDKPANVALDILLGTIGLDWIPNDEFEIVSIVPMPTRTWVINLGDRTADFSSSGTSSGGGGGSGGGAAGGAGGAAGGASSSAGGAGEGGVQGITSSNAQTSTESQSTVAISDDFWASIIKEVEARLNVLVPVSQAPAATGAGGALPAVQPTAPSTDPFREVRLGKVVANETTGVITVQAPRGVMDDIAHYLDMVSAAYNTRIVFEGRLFLLTTNKRNQRGIDWSIFKKFSSDYGLAVSNNVLGGVTITPPIDGPLSVTTGSQIASNGLGIISADNLLQVFSAYLESEAQVQTIQRPLLATTNGIPVSFSQTDKVYVNNVSENSSSTQAGSTTSRTNNLIPFEFGTSLRINPRYDASNRRVRALISLVQVIQSGFTDIDQFVSGTNGAAVPIRTRIPLDRRVEYQGETLLQDGSVVVLGGQQFSNRSTGGSGLTGLRKTPFGMLFGQETDEDTISTYYFALSVRTVTMDDPV